MDKQVSIVCIKNPFDPMVSRTVRSFPVGQSVREYAGHFFPAVPEGMDLCVSVNGHILERGLEVVYVPAPGDSIAFCAVPKGGKNFLGIIAMIALMVVAPAAGTYLAGTTMGLAGTTMMTVGTQIATAGVMIGGGMLINSIFPPKLPQFDGNKGFSGSRTYGWNAEPNAVDVGAPLPELFGTFRITPTMLSRYIELDGDKQYLNMLFAVAGHEIDGIDFESIRINKQPISNFVDVIPNVALGANEQDPLPNFSDSRTDVSINVPLSTDWVTRQTNGDCDAFSVALIAPSGLWHALDNGGLGTVTVTIEAEYRKVGDVDWVPWLGNTGFLPGPRFRARQSNTQFSINNDMTGFVGEYVSLPHYTEDTVRYKPGTRVRALHAGGYTEHLVLSTSVSSVDLGNGTYRVITLVNVDGTLPAGMTGFEWAPRFELSAAQNSAKRWMFKLDNPYAGFAQYEYRFQFALAPPSGTRYGTDVYIDFHQEITREILTYPNTALFSLRALATDQLSGGQPRVDLIAKRSTVPVWTGAAYEDKPATNPAWVNYHQLHDPLSGGGVPASRIVFSAFEDFAAWCDERGFTCNIYFDSAMNLKPAMDTVSMLGRGQVTQVGSKFTVMVDKPDTAVQRFMFTMGNIETGSLNQEWLGGEDRADEIEVTFWNAENEYERDSVKVYQKGYDSLTGAPNPQTITLYGCTDRTLASQYGQFLLNKNRYLTLTGGWGADIDAIGCVPGDVVDAAHDVPQWGLASGRVVSATAGTVTLDKEVTIDPGTTYVIEVKRADDTREMKSFTVEEPTTTDTFTLPSNWSTTPEKYDLYTMGPVNQHLKKFRVLEISKSSDLRRRLKCLEYVEEIYDDAADIPVPPPSLLATVAGLRAVEAWTVSSDGSGKSVVDLSWRGADLSWNIYMRQGTTGPWEKIDTAHGASYRITEPLIVGEVYNFAVSALGPESGASASVTILGKFWPPSDVQNLSAVATQSGIKVTWDHIPDIDRQEYVLKQGASWAAGIEIARINSNSFLWEIKPAGSYTFWIAALDSQAQESANPASFALNISIPSVSAVTPTMSNGVLRLAWEQSVGQFPIVEYIVAVGSTYEAALEVTRVKSTIVSFLVNWSETRRYWITPVDSAGNLGTASSVDVYITPPGVPLNVIPQVIYNYALIKWEEPSTHSLPIDYYLIKKGAVLGSAESLGELYATFFIRQELQGGAYTYWIAAVDTAGNTGTWASVNVTVDPPQGFVLRNDEYLDLSAPTASSGIMTVESGGILGPVVTGETWAQHFTNNSWNTPADQIAAGFPYYMQPAGATGYWQKTIDMGTSLPGSRVTVTPNITILAGTPTYTVDISLSSDNVNWTDFLNTLEVFGSAFRYVKVKVNISTDAGETGLLLINALRLTIALTKKTDRGRIQALSTDANGTIVSFNEDFIDVTAINPSVESTDFANIVYEFNDIPYPTEFKVRVFDINGNRITRYVSWTADGV